MYVIMSAAAGQCDISEGHREAQVPEHTGGDHRLSSHDAVHSEGERKMRERQVPPPHAILTCVSEAETGAEDCGLLSEEGVTKW